jgi:hypothetical protein
MAVAEPKAVVSSGVANKVSAMLLTRKTSRPSKLSNVSNTSPVKRETIPTNDHKLQGVGDETAIELEMVIARLDRRVNVIVPTEDRIVMLIVLSSRRPASKIGRVRSVVCGLLIAAGLDDWLASSKTGL